MINRQISSDVKQRVRGERRNKDDFVKFKESKTGNHKLLFNEQWSDVVIHKKEDELVTNQNGSNFSPHSKSWGNVNWVKLKAVEHYACDNAIKIILRDDATSMLSQP